jgi:hypothetical protein
MSFDLEKELLHGIPLDEAAGFFSMLTAGRIKQASAEELEEAWQKLEPEERLEAIKLAEGTPFLEHLQPGTEGYYSTRMLAVLQQMPAQTFLAKEANAGQLPPGAQGMNMSPSMPAALPSTAQGQNPVKMATAEDVGRERAHTQIATKHEKHTHSGGERAGKHIGTLLGAAAGAAAGHKAGGHGPLGAAMGALAGRSLGKDVGKSHDVKSFHEKMKHAAARLKIAFGEPGGLAPESASIEPNIHQYLASEEMGAEAEQANAAEYYRQKFQEAAAQLQQVQEQAEQTQTMTDTLEQQVAGSQEQIQAAMQQAQMASQAAMQNVQQAHEMAMGATQQAMESQQEVLRQKQLAAAMKMGITQVKDQVMSALASDPTDQLAQQLTSPPPGSGGVVGGAPAGQDPNAAAMQNPSQQAAGNPADPNTAAAGAGAPGQSPGAGTAPNSAGTGEEGENASDAKSEKTDSEKSEKKDPQATTKVEVKSAGVLGKFVNSKGLTDLGAGTLGGLTGLGIGVHEVKKLKEKKASFPLSIPHALGGAALGAGVGAAYAKSSNEPLKKKVNELSGVENRSFGQALDLAQSKARLALGEAAQEHPVATTIGSALHGAALGATSGPEITQSFGNIGQNLREAFQNLRATG